MVTDLVGMETDHAALAAVPDRTFYMAMDIYSLNSYRFGGQSAWSIINNIVLREPPVPPLTQLADLDEVRSTYF